MSEERNAGLLLLAALGGVAITVLALLLVASWAGGWAVEAILGGS